MATTVKTQKKQAKRIIAAIKNAEYVPPPPLSLLEQADQLINGPRQNDYGDKLQNFSQIAMGWQMLLATKLRPDAEIAPEDVALCMIQVKLARLAKSPDHKDSILDVAGYAGCYDLLQAERRAGKQLQGAVYDARETEVQCAS